MQPVPPLVITKVGGAARLLGDAALVTDTKLRTILGELDSGEKITNLPFPFAFIVLCVSPVDLSTLEDRSKWYS